MEIDNIQYICEKLCLFVCEELETYFGKSNTCVMKQKKEFHSMEKASQLRGRQV